MNATVDRLRAEGESLDALVAALEPGDWARPTPAAGWSIAHQVGHLQWTDEVALLAVRDPTAFVEVLAGAAGRPSIVDDEAAARAGLPPAALLSRWRSGRELLATALATATEQVPWFGPPMSPRSMTTARIMETWAHGQDVADALGVPRDLSDRLHDVAHLGVRTRDFSFRINHVAPPAEDFRVELSAADGEVSHRTSGGLLPARHPAPRARPARARRDRSRRGPVVGHRAGLCRPAEVRGARGSGHG